MNSKAPPGQRYHPDNYDEETELTNYVWENYRHLITNEERLLNHAKIIDKNTINPSHWMIKRLREKYKSKTAFEIDEVLNQGNKDFQNLVRDRVLRDSGDEVFINRCPACQRIVATPKARQCLWCGHDWH